MWKKLGLTFSIILIFLIGSSQSYAVGTDPGQYTWTWDSEIDTGDSYTWSVDLFTINETSVTHPNTNTRYNFSEGSTITIDVLDEPENYDILNTSQYDQENVFTINLDGEEVTSLEPNLFLFLYPVMYGSEIGTMEHIFDALLSGTNPTIYFFNGESSELEDENLVGSDPEYNKEAGEFEYQITSNDLDDDFNLQISWDFETGIMNTYAITHEGLELRINRENFNPIKETQFPLHSSLIAVFSLIVVSKIIRNRE